MAVPDKLAGIVETKRGEDVLAAAMVVPPGATLYKAFSPSSKVLGAAGPIVAALTSKRDGAASEGAAAAFPTEQGVLAVTSEKVVYFKKRLLGVGVGKQLIEWPRESITFTFEDNGKWSYPGLLIEFQDGSNCVVFGEKRWGLAGIAATTDL